MDAVHRELAKLPAGIYLGPQLSLPHRHRTNSVLHLEAEPPGNNLPEVNALEIIWQDLKDQSLRSNRYPSSIALGNRSELPEEPDPVRLCLIVKFADALPRIREPFRRELMPSEIVEPHVDVFWKHSRIAHVVASAKERHEWILSTHKQAADRPNPRVSVRRRVGDHDTIVWAKWNTFLSEPDGRAGCRWAMTQCAKETAGVRVQARRSERLAKASQMLAGGPSIPDCQTCRLVRGALSAIFRRELALPSLIPASRQSKR